MLVFLLSTNFKVKRMLHEGWRNQVFQDELQRSQRDAQEKAKIQLFLDRGKDLGLSGVPIEGTCLDGKSFHTLEGDKNPGTSAFDKNGNPTPERLALVGKFNYHNGVVAWVNEEGQMMVTALRHRGTEHGSESEVNGLFTTLQECGYKNQIFPVPIRSNETFAEYVPDRNFSGKDRPKLLLRGIPADDSEQMDRAA